MPSGRAVSNKAPVLLNWSGCESEVKCKLIVVVFLNNKHLFNVGLFSSVTHILCSA